MNDTREEEIMKDKIEKIGNSTIQHGKSNNRVYLMKLDLADTRNIIKEIELLAKQEGYAKIIAKIQADAFPNFIMNGYSIEAFVPGYYNGETDCVMVAKFLEESRGKYKEEELKLFFELLDSTDENGDTDITSDFKINLLGTGDAESITQILKRIFETYPFPVHDPNYILKTMQNNEARYFGAWDGDQLVGVSTAETDFASKNAEMTDFAVLPEYRGKKLAYHLLAFMEQEIKEEGIKTVYTVARLAEPGMNKTFMKAAYKYSGTLVNNTNIGGSIESMNIFYKHL